VEKTEPLKPDTHGDRRDHELFGKRPREMLKHLIVTGLIERADDCRCLFIYIARHDDPIHSPKDAGIIVPESIAPCVQD
jgi:hypothetical protein